MNLLAKKIREERKNKAMTLNEFGLKLGITGAMVRKLEQGKNLGNKSVKALAKYFKITIKEVYDLYESNEQV